jgi:hypothetical protein
MEQGRNRNGRREKNDDSHMITTICKQRLYRFATSLFEKQTISPAQSAQQRVHSASNHRKWRILDLPLPSLQEVDEAIPTINELSGLNRPVLALSFSFFVTPSSSARILCRGMLDAERHDVQPCLD